MRRLLVLGLMVTGLAAAGAAPAGAGPIGVHDNQILGSNGYQGKNVFDATGNTHIDDHGLTQTVLKSGRRGSTKEFKTKTKNLGTDAGIHVQGSGDAGCFRVHWYDSPQGNDLTSAVVSGFDGVVNPGASAVLVLSVHIRSCASPGQGQVFRLDVSPTGFGEPYDRVRARVKVLA
jgi:hypothetical protein